MCIFWGKLKAAPLSVITLQAHQPQIALEQLHLCHVTAAIPSEALRDVHSKYNI